MGLGRGRIRAAAALWLFCQTVTLVAVPIVLSTTLGQAAVECLCVHGDHSVCPMHHAPVRDSKTCIIGSTDAPALSALSSILIPSGPTVGPVPPAKAPRARLSLTVDATAASRRPAPPNPPPPRG